MIRPLPSLAAARREATGPRPASGPERTGGSLGAPAGIVCPLCGAPVPGDSAAACAACPLHPAGTGAAGCGLLCCPRCGYRFAERSRLLEALGRAVRALARLSPGRRTP